MRHLSPVDIESGTVLKNPLYHPSGLLLVPSGHALDEPRREAMRSLGVRKLHQPEPGEDVAPFLFQCQHAKVDLESLQEATALPYDLFDGSEALIASKDQAMNNETVALLEEAVAGGLFRKRGRKEMNLGQAEAFLSEFPVESPPADSDTKIMEADSSGRAGTSKKSKRADVRVLVAEDNDNIRTILVRFLTEAGFHVLETTDGKEALREAAQSAFDVAVLDIMMPRVNGLEVCRELKSKGKDAPIVIICTARNTRPDILTALRAGADDYIVKPFTREIITQKIALLLEQRAGRS